MRSRGDKRKELQQEGKNQGNQKYPERKFANTKNEKKTID